VLARTNCPNAQNIMHKCLVFVFIFLSVFGVLLKLPLYFTNIQESLAAGSRAS
jgi:hypothetical protein